MCLLLKKLNGWLMKVKNPSFQMAALLGLCLFLLPFRAQAWGFWAHQRINRMAVFTLPPEMLHLYKKNIEYLTAHAVDPDSRRYAVEGEAPRHFIDVDHYGKYPFENVPRKWKDAVAKFTEDTLMAYGIVPWHIQRAYYDLVDAFKSGDLQYIMKQSADIGHYIADSNVPLHTTENYNGQMTGQRGIHGLWESRLPELFAENYDFYIGRAEYIEHVLDEAWKTVLESHLALDSVLSFEKILTASFPSDQKYSFENRANVLIKAYSKSFCTAYHKMLAGQVECRLRASIQRVGSVWYTAWVDAGQPDLKLLMMQELIEEETPKDKKFKIIDREGGALGAKMDAYEMLFGNCCGHGMESCHRTAAVEHLDSSVPGQAHKGQQVEGEDKHAHDHH
jgi:hypothetical protein